MSQPDSMPTGLKRLYEAFTDTSEWPVLMPVASPRSSHAIWEAYPKVCRMRGVTLPILVNIRSRAYTDTLSCHAISHGRIVMVLEERIRQPIFRSTMTLTSISRFSACKPEAWLRANLLSAPTQGLEAFCFHKPPDSASRISSFQITLL